MSGTANSEQHETFLASDRLHILMITNHGIHQWDVVPGLPDTGGQNVFVNQFTETLADKGFKITIANRGGYPHPLTGDARQGLDYKDERQRILYLEDDVDQFVRKEDMNEQTPQLAQFLHDVLSEEGQAVDLIISHYWDAAKVGVLFNERQDEPVRHVWVPHSLGAIKKGNMPPDTWDDLRIDERITVEKETVPRLDALVATSALIRESLQEDYGVEEVLFLPPSVQTDRFYPREIEDDHEIWAFVAEHVPLSADDIRQRQIVTEISRTDETKRKDVLIEAFAQVHERMPQTLLMVSIDDVEDGLAADLRELIEELDLSSDVVVLGYVWDELPDLYAITDVYCSPSVMEGFGMSVQEAAATKVPVVGSEHIPFVDEYLLGDDVQTESLPGGEGELRVGDGAIVVAAEDAAAYAAALEKLLQDEGLRRKMGERAYDITIPHFTWEKMTDRFLDVLEWDAGKAKTNSKE